MLVVGHHQVKSWMKVGEWQNVEGKTVGVCFPARGKEQATLGEGGVDVGFTDLKMAGE